MHEHKVTKIIKEVRQFWGVQNLPKGKYGYDFKKKYGKRGEGFIEVHHVNPLSSLTEPVTINPNTDLVCVCSNCHRMIHHKKDDVLMVEQLKDKIKEAKLEGEGNENT